MSVTAKSGRSRDWPAGRVALLLAFGTPLGLACTPASAYWELIPEIGAGLTWESNPRYVSDELKDDVSGTFTDVRLIGALRTPANEVSGSFSFRDTNYLKANQDLNDDDWNADLNATHKAERGSVGLSAGYQESGIRTGEFESGIPGDPDAPPGTAGGTGRFSGGTQDSVNARATLTFALSPRNSAELSARTAETTYDLRDSQLIDAESYFDYTSGGVSLGMSHYFNEKNFFQLTLNGGSFTAEDPEGPFRNTTDSFGINAGYSRAVTPTLTASMTVGVARSSVDISGLPFDPLTGAFCPQSAPCAASDEDRNFVGSLNVRKRSERTTFNLDISRALAPRSNGTEVVQDDFRFFVNRTLTSRFSTDIGAVLTSSTAVGGLGRDDQDYRTIETRLNYRLTSTLSAYTTYSYVSTDDVVEKDVNNRLYFGITYRGTGLRR